MRGFWRNKRLLITAGPTREALDPVRFLSNHSTGRMGWALARAARRRGARVTLIAGPTAFRPPAGVRFVPVVSARDMERAALRCLRGADAVIGAAAVADWRPAQVSPRKIKKGRSAPVIRLVPNPDVLKSIARRRRKGIPRIAGFALETHHLLSEAKRKMIEKNLDLIVANPAEVIGRSVTDAWILSRQNAPRRVRGTKTRLAGALLDALAALP